MGYKINEKHKLRKYPYFTLEEIGIVLFLYILLIYLFLCTLHHQYSLEVSGLQLIFPIFTGRYATSRKGSHKL